MRVGGGQPHGAHRPEPPVTRGWRAGTAQLRLSRRGCACCTLSRPPPPTRTAERLRGAGLQLLTVDVSEVEKAEGAVTCCSVLVDERLH